MNCSIINVRKVGTKIVKIPISKHSESIVPHFLSSEHIEQMRRVGIVDVVICASVGEQEIDIVEAGNVRDGGCYITVGIDSGEIHVSLSIYGVCDQSQQRYEGGFFVIIEEPYRRGASSLQATERINEYCAGNI
jgi:hypothetical protein